MKKKKQGAFPFIYIFNFVLYASSFYVHTFFLSTGPTRIRTRGLLPLFFFLFPLYYFFNLIILYEILRSLISLYFLFMEIIQFMYKFSRSPYTVSDIIYFKLQFKKYLL
jgi:hypothetical protein